MSAAQSHAATEHCARVLPTGDMDSESVVPLFTLKYSVGPVPAEVLTAALYARFRSRQDHTFAEKLLSAMRHKFGGHVEERGP